ncbi:MAG: T9SS type A sorting domain-containing protein, partial [Bacteroidota bacterium]|nr:T9SS type A sorting domain-containing protein [Bacteroidota bacterium]
GSGNSLAYPFDIGPVSITSSNAGDQYYYFYYDIEIMPYATYIYRNICDGDSITIGNNVYNSPGEYTDLFTANNSCDSVVFTIIEFYQSPPLFIQTTPNPAEICLGEMVLLEGSAGFSYYWWDIFVFNIPISTGLTGSSLMDDPIVDTWYLLSAKDSNDCVVKEDIWVYVDSCISGLNEELISNINIYPNPSAGLFTVEFKRIKENNSTIRIVNSIGDMIFLKELKIGERSKQINLSTFSKGVYFIELQTDDGVSNKKLILR